MRLLDANLSPALVAPLTRAGHDVVHVTSPMLLALRRTTMPSVVLPQARDTPAKCRAMRPSRGNFPLVRQDLEAGAVVSLGPATSRNSQDLWIGVLRDLLITP